jgi:hypothetical protein
MWSCRCGGDTTRALASVRMSWRWTYDTGGASGEFPAQADAEAWLGESWQALYDDGVRAVTLLDGDREVYGPMSLEPG